MEDFKGKINDSKIVFILHVIGILVSLSLSVFMLTKAIILYDEKANITLQHTTIAFFTGFLLFLPILFLCCILFIRHYLLN